MCYRIRMSFGSGGESLASEVWSHNRVGLWHGTWQAKDLYEAYPQARRHGTGRLNFKVLAHELRHFGIGNFTDAATAVRFDDLQRNQWVFTVFGGRLHFAQIASVELETGPAEFDRGGQLFKSKRIENKKSFALSKLPDVYRVVASAGKGSCHKVPGATYLVNLLVNADSESDVVHHLNDLSKRDFNEWVKVLGPKGWESLCLGYLIVEHAFLPTGLVIGGSLADFDIVGKDRSGQAIYAQCKKSPGCYVIRQSDIEAFEQVSNATRFFFAYSGTNIPLDGVTHVDGEKMRSWLQCGGGQGYLRLLTM